LDPVKLFSATTLSEESGVPRHDVIDACQCSRQVLPHGCFRCREITGGDRVENPTVVEQDVVWFARFRQVELAQPINVTGACGDKRPEISNADRLAQSAMKQPVQMRKPFKIRRRKRSFLQDEDLPSRCDLVTSGGVLR